MNMELVKKEKYSIDDLLEIMKLLRSENGCPWDREQTHKTIRKNFIEETYEAVEAIDEENPEMLREELGDVLLQVVFHTQMEDEKGNFDFSDVCTEICKKLIVRHPHIFGDESIATATEVANRWEEIKKETKSQKTASETLKAVPKQLPALMRSEKLQQRAEKVGMPRQSTQAAIEKLEKDIETLKAGLSQNKNREYGNALGNILFSAVGVARALDLEPEECLTASSENFIKQFAEKEEALQK